MGSKAKEWRDRILAFAAESYASNIKSVGDCGESGEVGDQWIRIAMGTRWRGCIRLVFVQVQQTRAGMVYGPKKDIYEGIFRTPDYFIFDPFDPQSLQGWRLDLGKGYQALAANEQGWLWSETLGLWLGVWEGVIQREPATGTCSWLRFYDPEGNLVPLPEERAEQAEAELGQERQRTEQERQRAEQERQRAERLAELLRERGIDPDAI